MIERVAFAGSPDAAVVVLDALTDAGISVTRVVTRHDVRRGRGGAVAPTPVKVRAQQLGCPVYHEVADIACPDAQMAVVVAYGRLIPKSLLDKMPMVNVHFSLLPRWRGAAPVERAILAGDEATGVCIMKMEEGLDTGAIYSQSTTTIQPDDTTSSLTARLAMMGASELVTVLRNWPITPVPQSGESSYASKITPDELQIAWSMPARFIERQVRALPTYTFAPGGRRIRVITADLVSGGEAGSSRPGEVTASDVVRTGDGLLRLRTVQPEGRSAMSFTDWMRGLRHVGPVVLGDASSMEQ